MTTLLGLALIFKVFVILGRCPFCWNTQLVSETIDPGPDKDPNPHRLIARKTVCGRCHRTLTQSKHKASKHSP